MEPSDQHAVDVIEHAWIPMPDGCRLAARLWLPDISHREPVPAVLEYLPYRKRDGTAGRDAVVHTHFARNGYASVRVDIRGTGDSQGTFTDEYSPQEHADALAVIDWIAAQPWCTGAVGMMGISWGGFNSLQVAALRPKALKAIVTVCSTDDRYNDDCHYKGGTVVGDDMLPWAASLLAILAAPADASTLPDPARFRDAWKARIDSIEPPVHTWLAHQTRDAYWRYGSVCEDYAAIEAATLVVGGWADGYRNAAIRLLENLRCPRRGIVGPWAHAYPHLGRPGTPIDFLDECVRWWDRWLRGHASGAMDTPLLRTWIDGWNEPSANGVDRVGGWAGLQDWVNADRQTWYLADRTLRSEHPAPGSTDLSAPQDTGLYTGAWCSYGKPGDAPADQQVQDTAWTCFDSEPLAATLSVFGFPEFSCLVTADRPEAYLCLRLCDVAPDGASMLVSEGVLNLTHHRRHDAPQPLTPGVRIPVELRLNALAHRFEAGHRIRLAVSPTHFPRVWPAPAATVLTIDTGPTAALSLPLLAAGSDTVRFDPPPRGDDRTEAHVLAAAHHGREVTVDDESSRLRVVSDDGLQLLADRTVHGSSGEDVLSIRADDPLSAQARCTRSYTVGSADRPARVQIETVLVADPHAFSVHTRIDAHHGDDLVHTRTIAKQIPRTGSGQTRDVSK